MKIVHIAQYLNPGLGYQENLLPFYQQQLGHEVVLLTSTRSNGFNHMERRFPAGESIEHGFRVVRVDVSGELRDKFVFFRQLESFIEKEKPDYIFHHMPTTLSIRTVCKFKQKHPKVFLAVDNHADLSISIKNTLLRTLYYNIFWKSFLKLNEHPIDLYFGVTPARCLFLSEELGVPADKVRLLPIGVDTFQSQPILDRADFLKKFDLEDDCILVTHGGKMTPDKQIDRILTAFSRIKNDRIRLLLFGSIEDPQVTALMKQDQRIIHLGWLNRDDTLSVLQHSDFGIWNTRHTTLLEDSLAAGLPMILRYYGSTSHLIDQSGLFLYEGSVREIQGHLQLLIDQPALLDNFRANARRLREELSYQAIAAESVAYATDRAPQAIHRKFMTEEFGDPSYEYFRNIKTD